MEPTATPYTCRVKQPSLDLSSPQGFHPMYSIHCTNPPSTVLAHTDFESSPIGIRTPEDSFNHHISSIPND